MCVIAVKARGLQFPEKRYLQNCFDNNDDGAGFMYPHQGAVHIRKGYKTFDSFWRALNKVRKEVGDNAPFVMHFRVATQGFETGMTHPFPLADNYDIMKKMSVKCGIGIAHNGIIQMTSDGSKEYSDTMKFIKDYMSVLIRGFNWRKNDRIKNAIEGMTAGNKFAVMDKHGNVDLLGKGWLKEPVSGCEFSNSSYSYASYDSYLDRWWRGRPGWHGSKASATSGYAAASSTSPKEADDCDIIDDEFSLWRTRSGEYEFDELECPYTLYEDDGYCMQCKTRKDCMYWRGVTDPDNYLEGGEK